MKAQSASPYEVHCHRCRVTFPVGTKTCVHCGGRTARQPVHAVAAGALATRADPDAGPLPPLVDEISEEDLPTRRPPFSPMTAVWILAILGVTIQRACSG